VQPGQQVGRTGELPQLGGGGQRQQHCQATGERGDHRSGDHTLGTQPQQTQAQAHQRQHGQMGSATGARDAGPAEYVTGWPAASAHADSGEARATVAALPCLTLLVPAVPVVRWEEMLPEGLAAKVSGAATARPCGGLPPAPGAMHPVTRIAIAPSSAPARSDRARICEAVIATLPACLRGHPLDGVRPRWVPSGVSGHRRCRHAQAATIRALPPLRRQCL